MLKFVAAVLGRSFLITVAITISGGLLYIITVKEVPQTLAAWGIYPVDASRIAMERQYWAPVLAGSWIVFLLIAETIIWVFWSLSTRDAHIDAAERYDRQARRGSKAMSFWDNVGRAFIELTIVAGTTWIAMGALVLVPEMRAMWDAVASGSLLCLGAVVVGRAMRTDLRKELTRFVMDYRKATFSLVRGGTEDEE